MVIHKIQTEKFSIFSYDETVNENNICLSQSALKLAYANVEFQKHFSTGTRVHTTDPVQKKARNGEGRNGIEKKVEGKEEWELPAQ